MLRVLAALALLTVACADEAQPVEQKTGAAGAALEAPEVQEPPACEVVFTPTAIPALVAEVTLAAERWSQATGCDIRVGEGGIVVEQSAADDPRLWNARAGRFSSGVTLFTPAGTLIVVREERVSEVIPHEMGHALAHTSGHGSDEAGLTHGLAVTDCIRAADLEYVCEALDCAVFTPESCE
jgi:hypothetical protein